MSRTTGPLLVGTGAAVVLALARATAATVRAGAAALDARDDLPDPFRGDPMARPIQPGDTIPGSPPLKVVRTHVRDDGHLVVDVAVPDDHPAAEVLRAGALGNVSVDWDGTDLAALIGHPGHEQDQP